MEKYQKYISKYQQMYPDIAVGGKSVKMIQSIKNAAQLNDYQAVYKSLLSNTDLQSINRFKNTKASHILYPDAHQYPEFFRHNLLSPGRVIKVIKGKNAILKSFYYQLMKLAFQIQVNDKDYVQILKSGIFNPNLLSQANEFTSPTSGRGYTDQQYKKLIAEFIQIMTQQSIPNFELTIMEYPIVDEALMRAFQTLVVKQYVRNKGTSDQLLKWLANKFQVTLIQFQRCYKFDQSDIFIYEEGTQEYYISYLNEMAEVSDYSQSTYRKQDNKNESNQKPMTDKHFRSFSSQDENQKLSQIYSDRYRYSAQIQHLRTDSKQEINSVYSARPHRKTIDNLRPSKDSDQKSQSIRLRDNLSADIDQHPRDSIIDIVLSPDQRKIPSNIMEAFAGKVDSHQIIIDDISGNQWKNDYVTSSYEEKPYKYISSEEQFTKTPKFSLDKPSSPLQSWKQIEQQENPFTKKYSQTYMPTIYEKTVNGYQSEFDKLTSKIHHTTSIVTPDLKRQNSKEFSTYDYSSKDKNTKQLPSYLQQNQTPSYFQHNETPSYFKQKQTPSYFQQKQTPSYLQKKKTPSYLQPKQTFPPYNLHQNRNQTANQSQSLQFFSTFSSSKPSNFDHIHEQKEEDIFYKPSSTFKASTAPSRFKQQTKKQEIRNQPNTNDSLGTFYRQFSDTKVMNVMTSFERMKVANIRKRFKGIHRKDFMGFH